MLEAPMLTPIFSVEIVIFAMLDNQLHVRLLPDDAKTGFHLPVIRVKSQDCNLDHTVRRGIQQVVSQAAGFVEQVKAVGNTTRDENGWSVAVIYYALMALDDNAINSKSDWIKLSDIDSLQILKDHLGIIHSCYRRLKSKAQFTSLPLYLLPEEFTLSELQMVYEALLTTHLDKKSFRRRLLDSDLLVATDNMRHGNNRPAQLYKVVPGHIIHHFSRHMHGSHKECV
jgi:8-oxo-dGTP diphosphatase